MALCNTMYCHVIVAHVSGLLRVNSSLVGDHQMASACKQYITERGHVSVWDVPPATLLQRLDACKKLYQYYQECFNQSKQHVRSSHRPFEISEMYVFGKFASFCRRLDQIQSLVDTLQQCYSSLTLSVSECDRSQ